MSETEPRVIGQYEIQVTDPTASRKAFNAAMAKAQGAIEHASKTAKNDAFKREGVASKYADLSAVWSACREQLTSNGLAVMQFPDFDAESGCAVVNTIITHIDGFERSFYLRVPVRSRDAHGVGSAITYARRYALMAAVGIAAEDDDGNAAVEAPKAAKTPRQVGVRADGNPTAAASKPAWAGFLAKLHAFKDVEDCTRWFDDPETQNKINSWPKGDMGDWAELAADEFDSHMKTLYGTGGTA